MTAAGEALLDDANAAAQRATLGAQAADATLTSLSGLTLAAGDLLYATGPDTLVKLGIGTAGQVLQTNSGATAPEWGTSAILEAIAAAAVGSVGTYIWGTASTNLSFGGTLSGASITPAGTRNAADIDLTSGGGPLSGTWRLMGGNSSGTVTLMTLWLRIA